VGLITTKFFVNIVKFQSTRKVLNGSFVRQITISPPT
jgi:hypothetical protein